MSLAPVVPDIWNVWEPILRRCVEWLNRRLTA